MADKSMFHVKENCEMEFIRVKHTKYCLRTLHVLPDICEAYDSTRLVLAFFAISTLDLLNALHSLEDLRDYFIEWIYHLQVVPDENEENSNKCGFRGSAPCTVFTPELCNSEYSDKPHITMTYAALATLLILGDDLKRVERKSIIRSLKPLQLADGSFRPTADDSENDMRFIYCACCISYILQDWSGIDIESAIDYIRKSITYEGGIAQGPGLEAHGGSTFCAVASLCLMNKLNRLTKKELANLQRWCLFRQIDGFQGRPNKPTDTCYSFWVGATLKILKCYHYADLDELRKYILSTQDPFVGGIAKGINDIPDPLHTYMAISGLSLMNLDDISPVHPALNISQRAFAHLSTLHKKWAEEEER